MKRIWIQLFHIYQPPFQTKETVDKVAKESYELLASLHERYPNLRSTWNISGSLLELLERYGHAPLIERIAALAEKGQIEITGSGTYHPIIPLISEEAATRQIHLHEQLLEKYLRIKKSSLKTFYFPEMAWSPDAGRLVASLGYTQTVLDESHHPEPKHYSSATVYPDMSGMQALLRISSFSRTFPPEHFFKQTGELPRTLVVAHDGELYGHWHANDYGFYEKLFTSPDMEFMTVSQYIHAQSVAVKPEKIELLKGSWETKPEERANYIPFGLWDNPTNKLHQALWESQRKCESILSTNTSDLNYEKALMIFDKGCTSCTWWWASNIRIGPFAYLTWNPTDIVRGATFLAESIRTLHSAAKADRESVEAWYRTFTEKVWSENWKNIEHTS